MHSLVKSGALLLFLFTSCNCVYKSFWLVFTLIEADPCKNKIFRRFAEHYPPHRRMEGSIKPMTFYLRKVKSQDKENSTKESE